MSTDNDTLAGQLERTPLAGDAIEGERLRKAVKARLLAEAATETRIDRFVVLGQLGAGGMGIVYAAYDPELDRKVAIKLVRTWGTERRAEDQERLVREARALAKLSHPNVVAVYEVGIHGDSVFIAMEFVRGKTLHEHIAPGHTPWREVVRAYIQAGEALAAAHEAGLVHRDFKPDNALVGDDGRVRVVDFGLARGEGTDERASASTSSDRAGGIALTATGAVIGTPAYMAPEQRLGLPVVPRTDQYSFCASLHEALVGTPPIRDAEGAAHVGTLPPSLPARLRRALVRGLSHVADDRFPDMRVLVAELRSTLETSRRLRMAVGLAAIVGIGAGAAIAAAIGNTEPCPDPTPELADVWSDSHRVALHAAAAELGEDASTSAAIVERELDARAAAWIEGRRDTCNALYVRRTDSEALFDRRMRCLDRGREAMRELVGLLEESDAVTWQHAVDAVLGLAPNDACADVESLTIEAAPPVDPASAAEVDRVRATIDRALTLEHLGKLADARPLAEAAVTDALRIGHRPTEAEALRALAEIESAQEHDAAAAPLLEDAVWRAEAGRADELAAELLARSMAVAALRGRVAEALALERRVVGVLERLGRPSRVEVQFLRSRFLLASAEGRFDDAEAHARAGIDASRRWSGERSLDVARHVNNLGHVQYERGEYDAAEEALATALAIKREWLAEQHPDVINARSNLASVYERQGRTDEARTMLEAAIVDAEHALTGPSPVLAMALDNLANLHQQAGRYAEALPLVRRSIAALEASVGPDDPRVMKTLLLLGILEDELGRKAESRAAYERVVAIAERIDPDHAIKAYAWNNLAVLALGRGEAEMARDISTKALALWTRTHGPEHPVTGQLAYSLARADLASGATSDAIAHAQQAIPVLARGGSVDAASLAGAHFVLAKALLLERPTAGRAEAIAAAEAAIATYSGIGAADGEADVRAWLAARRLQ